MPIRFRCTFCNRLLGIATRKAGTDTTCPHCGFALTVPTPTEEEARTERINMEDVDELLGHGATERVSEPATQVVPPAPPLVPAVSPRLPPDATRAEKPRPAKVTPPPVPKAQSAIRPAQPGARPAPPPVPKAPAANPPFDEPPLFEGDMDELLGKTAPPPSAERKAPTPTSGTDALSLGDPPRVIVLSTAKAVLLLCGVVLLLALAFATGFFVARPR